MSEYLRSRFLAGRSALARLAVPLGEAHPKVADDTLAQNRTLVFARHVITASSLAQNVLGVSIQMYSVGSLATFSIR